MLIAKNKNIKEADFLTHPDINNALQRTKISKNNFFYFSTQVSVQQLHLVLREK